MHLQSDTLSSALRGPLKVLSPEMNVSSGVSKVNIIYIRQKHVLFPVTLTALIFLGLLFGMFWDVQYSNFRIFKDLLNFFSCKIFIKNKVCLPIDRLNIEDVFVK